MRLRPIPLAEAATLAGPARRTAAVRLALAVALLLVLALALLAAFRSDRPARTFVAPGRSAVVVLDLSSSISAITYRQIEQTLRELIATGDRYGLVVFSDIAYEAFPPQTPAKELEPLLRYFTPLGRARPTVGYPSYSLGNQPFAVNPWTNALTGGTRITSGLRAALAALRRDGVRNGSIVLVSDLDDDYLDVPQLADTFTAIARADVDIRIVGLQPSDEDAALFGALLGGQDRIERAQLPAVRPSRT
ncbi:MAG: von Willebrand factor type domain, partial [Gaiellaceae bacterium]|nr:von Willebrand factor type domain [Gaiellaceae bacterium]